MSAKKPVIRAVLFDLGKVLLHFSFDPAFKRLANRCSVSAKDVEDYFVMSGIEVPYDGGKCTSRQFYAQIRKALKLDLDFDGFRRVWTGIFTPNARMVGLVRRLRRAGRHRLVLISNTNAMHYDYIRGRYPMLGLFDRHVLSFREKRRKPDPRIYRTALRACRAKSHEVFYIDDRADLTSAAAEMGFHTYTFKNDVDALLKRMKELEIL